MYPMSSTVYLSLVMNLNKDWGGGEAQRNLRCTHEVTFSARGQLRCNTTQRHKHKHKQWREERDACFLAGNTVIILSY